MTSLTSGALADVLQDLVRAASDESARMPRRPPEERHRREQPAGGSRAVFAAAKDRFMAVSPETGRLLYVLARTARAHTVVEFGTSFGVSTLYLAAAVWDNGGAGRVIGTEYEPTKVAAVRRSLERAGVEGLVEIREGDALQTLAADLPDQVDLVLLDGAKEMYLDVLRLLEPRLGTGAVVVADNASRSAEYRQYVQHDDRYVSTSLEEADLEISCRT